MVIWFMAWLGAISGSDAKSGFSATNREKALAVTVRIIGRDSGSYGSGAIVGYRAKRLYILTAAHVLRDTKAPAVEIFENLDSTTTRRIFRGLSVEMNDEESDVALLSVPDDKAPPAIATIAPNAKSLGRVRNSPVLLSGCPDGLDRRLIEMKLLDERLLDRGQDREAFFWRTNTGSRPGHSGGPLFDSQMRVIGLAALRRDRFGAGKRDEEGYFCHTDEIARQLITRDFDWLLRPTP